MPPRRARRRHRGGRRRVGEGIQYQDHPPARVEQVLRCRGGAGGARRSWVSPSPLTPTDRISNRQRCGIINTDRLRARYRQFNSSGDELALRGATVLNVVAWSHTWVGARFEWHPPHHLGSRASGRRDPDQYPAARDPARRRLDRRQYRIGGRPTRHRDGRDLRWQHSGLPERDARRRPSPARRTHRAD